MAATVLEYLSRIESLGDNCELGFVLRNATYEKGSLFRWTITPIDKLICYLADPEQKLFLANDLVPFAPGMVLDQQSGFSFHSKMRSEKNDQGQLDYIHDESERHEIYKKEKAKIDYLKTGFSQRLNDKSGSIYLIKANKGIAEKKIIKLASQLKNHSDKHVLVEVKSADDNTESGQIEDMGAYYRTHISRFAPYIAANDICYEDWDKLILNLMQHEAINAKIDS